MKEIKDKIHNIFKVAAPICCKKPMKLKNAITQQELAFQCKQCGNVEISIVMWDE